MSGKVGLAVKKPGNKERDTVSNKPKPDFSQSVAVNSPMEQVLQLQRTIGNQAVTRLIQSGAIHAKLKIGQPEDMYEQEADRVAEQIMRMSEGSLARKESESGCPECFEEVNSPMIQRQIEEEEEEELVQTKSAPGSTSQVNADIESRIQSMSGGGQPLSESTRAFFEPRFGVDFSQVRVHQDAESGDISASLGARAFTLGKDIRMGRGESTSDKRLMAHELTHVVQQKGMSSSSNYINCDNGGESTPKVCGPDITQVIITHLNDVVSQEQGDLSWIWMLGALELERYARDNGQRIRNAADQVSDCPSHEDCGGAYTVAGHCISGRHIDHILIMCYIEASYGALNARSAGQYNESLWLGALTEGFWFEGSSDAVANADLTFNEIAICLGEHMAHAEESDEDITDLLAREEVRECFEGLDMSVIGAKSSSTESTAYSDCTPCSIPAPMPADLELPPIDL